MYKRPGSYGFPDQALVDMLTSSQLSDYKENWQPLGYGVDVFARWEITLTNSALPSMFDSYHARLHFTERWWEASRGDVYRAHEAATYRLTPDELVEYEKGGFKAIWKMADFKKAGYGKAIVKALNSVDFSVRKDLLDTTPDYQERFKSLVGLMTSNDGLQETALSYTVDLIANVDVLTTKNLAPEDAAEAVRRIDSTVSRIYGFNKMDNYAELISLFHTQILEPALKYGHSIHPFVDVFSDLDKEEQVDTLMSWAKASKGKNVIPSFSNPENIEAIKNCVPHEWHVAHGGDEA